ncbi:MAG TPA: hypothetical protein VGL80_25230 [Pseudonocardiaceae bacterium]
MLVTLTPAGHATVERTVALVLGREAELVSVLSAEQQTQLAELLGVLLDQVTDPRPRTASQPLDG